MFFKDVQQYINSMFVWNQRLIFPLVIVVIIDWKTSWYAYNCLSNQALFLKKFLFYSIIQVFRIIVQHNVK